MSEVTPDYIVDTNAAPQGGNGPGGGFSPSQILQAYGIGNIAFGGTAGNGSGETIAIVDAYNNPNIVSDLQTFDAQFGLANSSLSVVNQTGGSSLPGNNSSWGLEEALDVEWAHAIAPAANIMLVEASSNSSSDLLQGVSYAAAQTGVCVVSMSWGSPNPQSGGSFSQPGVTFVAASGDSGAPGIWPAGSSQVVAVGGTSLTLNASNNYQSESAWSGSGGGINTAVSEPAYQSGVQNTGSRSLPDVAFDANPNTGVSVYDGGKWQVIGGTSLAAPAWAGLVSIIDQGRALATQPAYSSSAFLTALYSLPSSDFHDITSGSNGTYSAGPGYDYVTGLGSPIANLLVPALVGVTDTVSLTMNLIDGNNLINAAQIASGITITGTATGSIMSNIVGQAVTVAFNGHNYTGTVASGGGWSVAIPSSALSGLTDGAGYLARASITDAAGNSATDAHTATVDKTLSMTMNLIDGNNFINAAQAAAGITITGTASDSVMANIVGRTVTVSLNGNTYSGTVASNGTWSVGVPSSALSALSDGTGYLAIAKVTDKAGNAAAASHTATVDKTLTMTMNLIDGNNFINAAQVAGGITITGTATDSVMANVVGRTVTVSLNGAIYSGVVASNGTWSVGIPSSGLSALTDGTGYLAIAKVSDKAGNMTAASHSATVDLTASAAITPIDGNGYITGSNIAGGITISGTTTGSIGDTDDAGRTLTIRLNGKSYAATVGAHGAWSVNVPSADLSLLADGATYTVTASGYDRASNPISGSANVTVLNNNVAWGSASGNWGVAADWQGAALPGANDLANLNLASGETVAFDASTGNQAVGGAVLSGNGTFTQSGGTLNISHSLDLQGGTLELDGGTLQNATIINTGGAIHFNGVTLNNVTVDGAMNITQDSDYAYITGGLTLTGSNGTGPGSLSLSGYAVDLIPDGNLTLDNATITLSATSAFPGGNGIYNADSAGTGAVLTLGKNLVLDVASGAYARLGAFYNDLPGDGIANQGMINVGNNGTLYITPDNFTNGVTGNITVSNGATVNVGSSGETVTNAGTISGNAATMDFTNLNNTGTITIANSMTTNGVGPSITFDNLANSGTLNITNSVVYLSGATSASVLSQFANDGDVLCDFGTLNNGGTLTVGTGTGLTNIWINGGTINGGTVVDQGSGFVLDTATLQNVTYDGALNVFVPNITFTPGEDPNTSNIPSSVYITGALTTHAQNGTGPGTINITGTADGLPGVTNSLYLEGTQMLDNATVTMGSPGYSDYLSNDDADGSGSVLTLGSGLTVNATGGGNAYLSSAGSNMAGDGIINNGVINAGGTNSLLTINADNFTNYGTLNAASGGTIDVTVAETGNGSATISGTGEIIYQNAASDNVTFASGATGTLALGDSTAFTGTISGFTGAGTPSTSDKIDLQDINFATLTDSYSGGMLTVSDGTHTANLHFAGSYTLSNFKFSADSSGGTMIIDPPMASTASETAYQRLVQDMAAFVAQGGAGAIAHNPPPPVLLSQLAYPAHLPHK